MINTWYISSSFNFETSSEIQRGKAESSNLVPIGTGLHKVKSKLQLKNVFHKTHAETVVVILLFLTSLLSNTFRDLYYEGHRKNFKCGKWIVVGP